MRSAIGATSSTAAPSFFRACPSLALASIQTNSIKDLKMIQQTTPTIPSSNAAEDNGRSKPAAQSSHWEAIVFFCLMLTLMLALVFWPSTKQLIPGLRTPTPAEYLGAVQRITFVGGLGKTTQIDTESRTFLLQGAVQINKGVRLELRRGIMDVEVCEVATQNCRDLVSH
jgi:hypothetical protein